MQLKSYQMFTPIKPFLWAVLLMGLPALGRAQSCQISISPSVINACIGDTIPLLVTGGNGTYSWGPNPMLSCTNCPNPLLTVTGNTSLYVSSGGSGTLPATNGAFTNGNTGFTTQYTYNATSIWNPATYAITTSANLVHPNFSAWPDHTTGTGMYLCANGSTTANLVVWQQPVAFPPGAQVTMNYWILTLATPASSIRTKVNGVQVGQVLSAPLTVGVWTQHTQTFTAGTGPTTLIALESVFTASAGNDFSLDDISFTYTCQDSDTLNVIGKPRPNFSVTLTDTTGCGLVCPTFQATLGAGPSVSSIDWDFGDGTTGTGLSPTHCYNTPGTYSVTVTATTLSGCNRTLVRNSITVLPGAQIQANPSDTFGCGSLCVSWQNQSTSTAGYPISSILWDFGDGTTDTAWAPTHCYTTTGRFTVKLTVSVQGGCTTTRTWLQQIQVGSYPTIGIQATRWRLHPDSAQVGFQAVGAPIGSRYFWTFGDGDSSSFPMAVHTYVPDTHYVVCLVVVSPEGCADTTCMDLWSIIRIQTPNVLTPNGDNVNDFWFPTTQGADWLRTTIHNRWGVRVFSSDALEVRWDGTDHGRPVPDGVYFVTLLAGNGGGLTGQERVAVHVLR